MKNFAFLIFLLTSTLSLQAQEKGLLMHYQKKGANCLALAGEKYDASKFFIIVHDTVYSGGTIQVKHIEEADFKVKKAVFKFGQNSYTSTEFHIRGKKNILAFEKWISGKISKDPTGNTMLRVINGQTVSYLYALKGRKLYLNIQTGV